MAFIEATTLGDLLDRAASRHQDSPALVFPDARLSYGELSTASDAFARSLLALGVSRDDKVGILMGNCPNFVVGLFAAAKVGAVAVPINARFKARELGHVVEHGDIRALLTSRDPAGVDYADLLGSVFPELATQDPHSLHVARAPRLRQVVNLGPAAAAGHMDRSTFLEAGEDVSIEDVRRRQERVRIRDVGMLMYTSGTTSKPKGCLLTHEALTRHGRNVALTRFSLTERDRFWDPLPLFHIGGIVPMLGCFSVGARYCHAGHFLPDTALRMLEQERVTVAYPAFETIWLAVLDHPRFAEHDLSSIRLIQNIAVPERLLRMEQRMPWAKTVSSFGATECSSNLTLSRPEDPADVRLLTLGTVVPGMEAKVVDLETGEDAAPGTVGELLFRGYARFEGYYKAPELTAEAIDEEGWFHSQDLATCDAHGRFQYAGRLKDMLKVGGENVSALEVEDFIATHPAVAIVQVLGASDARYGEVPAAFVQLNRDASLSEEELIAFCVGQIATYKVPRYLRIVRAEEWPMSGTKIQKFKLRERINAELAAAGISQAPKIDARLATEPTG